MVRKYLQKSNPSQSEPKSCSLLPAKNTEITKPARAFEFLGFFLWLLVLRGLKFCRLLATQAAGRKEKSAAETKQPNRRRLRRSLERQSLEPLQSRGKRASRSIRLEFINVAAAGVRLEQIARAVKRQPLRCA